MSKTRAGIGQLNGTKASSAPAQGRECCFLELGVGYNTPGIIKYPFWRMTARNPKATYACINLGEVGAPPEIEDRSILLSEDIGAALQALREA